MALNDFERRLERLVEGAFAKAFRRGLNPLEVARRITREMDVRRTVGVRGVIAPNSFTVVWGPADNETFAKAGQSLTAEWTGYAREHGREEGYQFVGPVQVDIRVDDGLRPGEFHVESEMVEGPGGGPVGALVLPDGTRFRVGDEPVSIGRAPGNDVVLDHSYVSKQHAEVRREAGDFVVVDLGSLNGTSVNRTRVRERRVLAHADEIQIDPFTLRFELE